MDDRDQFQQVAGESRALTWDHWIMGPTRGPQSHAVS